MRFIFPDAWAYCSLTSCAVRMEWAFSQGWGQNISKVPTCTSAGGATACPGAAGLVPAFANLRAPICNSEKTLTVRAPGLLPIILLQGCLYANELYLMGLWWPMWQRFGLTISSYSATAFIDLETQEPSQVIKCRYWSCSITSTLLTPCQGPRATRQTCFPNLKDGKSQLGRGRPWREWGYTPV